VEINRVTIHILAAIFAIPFALLVIWAIGIFIFGMSILLVYVAYAESGFGYLSTALYGTLTNLGLFGLFYFGSIAGDHYNLERYGFTDKLFSYALAEMILIIFITGGNASGWNW